MNILRKIAQWIWLNKERMVLAVMVIFLIYRVYEVVNPEVEQVAENYRPPEPRGNIGVTVPPPLKPLPTPPPDMTRRHPFVWIGVNQGPGGNDEGPDVDLRLLQIMENRGEWRARIRSQVKTYWVSEGEKLESWEVIEINPDEETVVVYLYDLNDQVILRLQD